MTAKKLIKELQKLVQKHGDREVYTEGCDCIGKSVRVEYDKTLDDAFLICRN